MKRTVTVQTTVNASLEKSWDYWNKPEHITGWAFDSEDWEVTHAENNLHVGGIFRIGTQAKNGSENVDFVGIYTNVKEYQLIEYEFDDGRNVKVEFKETSDGVQVTESFEPDDESTEVQRAAWQATLDNFKSYVEK
jgi:uncharacterized protein YndB with AHSA1/START domain